MRLEDGIHERRRAQRTGAALVAGLTLLLGACTVSTSPDRPQSQQDQFERDRAVRYDLSTPPISA